MTFKDQLTSAIQKIVGQISIKEACIWNKESDISDLESEIEELSEEIRTLKKELITLQNHLKDYKEPNV